LRGPRRPAHLWHRTLSQRPRVASGPLPRQASSPLPLREDKVAEAAGSQPRLRHHYPRQALPHLRQLARLRGESLMPMARNQAAYTAEEKIMADALASEHGLEID